MLVCGVLHHDVDTLVNWLCLCINNDAIMPLENMDFFRHTIDFAAVTADAFVLLHHRCSLGPRCGRSFHCICGTVYIYDNQPRSGDAVRWWIAAECCTGEFCLVLFFAVRKIQSHKTSVVFSSSFHLNSIPTWSSLRTLIVAYDSYDGYIGTAAIR